MPPKNRIVLLELQFLSGLLLVLGRGVEAKFRLCALQGNNFSWHPARPIPGRKAAVPMERRPSLTHTFVFRLRVPEMLLQSNASPELVQNFRHRTGAHRAAALANREA